MYDSDCARGGDRQLRLLIKWNCFSGTYAVPSMVSPTVLAHHYGQSLQMDMMELYRMIVFAALLKNLFTIRDSSSHQADSPVFPDDAYSVSAFMSLSIPIPVQISPKGAH